MKTMWKTRKTAVRALSLGLVCTLSVSGLAACSAGSAQTTTSGVASPSTTDPTASPATGRRLPQPEVGGLDVAPESDRVDLEVPTFTNPTEVTNPLFPVSAQESVLLLGTVDGQDFRTEVTLLDHTRVLPWDGGRVEVLVSQYVAFLDGRIHEVAYDLYAQDDNGAVWYFGEDVYNFTDGFISDTHGTWIAGVDGPPAMIMPAAPAPGDVYRPENVPGLVFEEVTVTSTDDRFHGPFAKGQGALLISEMHMDGTREDKTFAPGYGEFYTSGGGDVEALALGVPTDRASGPVPAPIADLGRHAAAAYDASARGDSRAAEKALAAAKASWRAIDPLDVPRLVRPVLQRSLSGLGRAVETRDVRGSAQAAIDVARSALDLRLRYESPDAVDVERLDLWLAQMLLDAEYHDTKAVRGDFFAIDYVRDRIRAGTNEPSRTRLDTELESLLDAINEDDIAAVANVVVRLRTILGNMTAGHR